MSQVTTPTEPGWLPDPSGRYEWRYWDGGWTNRVANSTPAGAEPSAATPAPPPAPAPAAVAPTEPVAPAPVSEPAPLIVPPEAAVAAATAVAESAAEPAAPLTARDAVPRVPFGTDPEPGTATPAPTRKRRRTPWAVIAAFFKSFADEPESYHSELAREPLPPDHRGERMV